MSDLLDGSVVVGRLERATRRTRRRLRAATERSGVAGAVEAAGDTLGRWTRGSWLYGWLTAEPDPEVIVIDLRETYTVGPLIAAIDRAAAWLGPRWRGSRPKRGLDRAATPLATVTRESRVVSLLAALVTPPESDADARDR